MRHLAVAGLLSLSLIVACGDETSNTLPNEEILYDDLTSQVSRFESNDMRCVVVSTSSGAVAIDCDWEER